MNFELRLDETLVIDSVEYDPVGIMNGMHHVNTPTRRFPTEYSIAMYFVCVNRDAFEYADCISITEDRRIIPNEYLYRDGEYQWVESYRNAPKADMIWARANMKAIIERYADNADRLGSYVNQFPIKVFETYDELYDFIFKITPYEGNIDVIYQLIENYDREYFKKYCLVVAVGNEKRSDETTDETDVEFYYEIKDGEMTVYVNDVVGKWYGRAFCRFYDIPREDLAAVNRYSCQYDAESWNGE